jgi:predicted RNA-binding protein with PUA-like domain
VKEYYQDPTTKEDAWVCVDIAPYKELKKPIELSDLKKDKLLKDMQFVKIGRLSVSVVKPEEFYKVCEMGGL